MWVTAACTWSRPRLCSRDAAAISFMIAVTRCTEATTSSIVELALVTRAAPVSTVRTESPISPLISLAAAALLWARLRTSEATTAKPVPARRPARLRLRR
jgi:hypothetical protein